MKKRKIRFLYPPKLWAGYLRPNQEYWFLTEDGLYEVLMQSRKPKAKEFKKEVKKILKSIRKTGGYVVRPSRGAFNLTEWTHYIGRNSIQKNEQKNFESAAAFSDL